MERVEVFVGHEDAAFGQGADDVVAHGGEEGAVEAGTVEAAEADRARAFVGEDDAEGAQGLASDAAQRRSAAARARNSLAVKSRPLSTSSVGPPNCVQAAAMRVR